MLAAALRTVAHNDLGSNMEAGLIVALDRAQTAPFAILEDDELYLGPLLRATRPRVLTLVDRRVVTRPNAELGLPALSGYETRRGRAMLGPGVARSPSSRSGPGEVATPTGHATDGAVQGHVVGTWFHGPVLPRNPELADLLLE
jgi:hypothetical protein